MSTLSLRVVMALVVLVWMLPTATVSAQADWADRLRGAVPILPPSDSSEPARPADDSSEVVPVGMEYATLVSGLREALQVGASRAVESAGQPGGFLDNAQIRIPMPGYLNDASNLLRGVGLGRYIDDFERSMNQAAERAAPQATDILINTITQMSIEDARGIMVGAPDSATRYLRRTAGEDIKQALTPIIAESMAETGVTSAYTSLSEQATTRAPMLTGSSSLDLDEYVTEKTMDGLFTLIAAEEGKIRTDPAARTTEILTTVFGR